MTADKINQDTNVVRSINENTKRYFDTVESLRQAAWQSFNQRRAFEWKLSFGLWTALSAIIAGLAIGQATLKSTPERWVLSAISVVVVVLHGLWSFFLNKVNRADLDKSYVYEREEMLALGLAEHTKAGDDIQKTIVSMTGRGWLGKHWGHFTQVAVTIILAVGITVVAWLR
jgi:hypothetical protein